MVRRSHFTHWTLAATALWLAAVLASLLWYVDVRQAMTVELAHKEAVANFNKDLAIRYWASRHGGIYAPVTNETQPSQLLESHPERDIITPWGTKLTLMNPAYIPRQVAEEYEALCGPSDVRCQIHWSDWENRGSWEAATRQRLARESQGDTCAFLSPRPRQ